MTSLAIAIPVLNEAEVLAETVIAVRAAVPPEYAATVIIADNGSQDDTPQLARQLERWCGNVRYLRLEERGKGRAVRAAWEQYPADISAFMDADLSTDLSALPPLLAAIEAGADVAIGSRHHPQSQVERSLSRKVWSLGYRGLLHAAFTPPFADAPCGFKAIRASAREALLPLTRSGTWFFDTELLLHAQHRGLRIAEVPVVWRDGGASGRPSKAMPWPIIREYVREIRRMRRELA